METIPCDRDAFDRLLLRHANRFGTDGVLATAVEQWLPGPKTVYAGDWFSYDVGSEIVAADERRRRRNQCARLRVEVEAIAAGQRTGFRGLGRPTRRRRSSAETADAVRMLRSEGLVESAIADKLGITDATVRRCLKAENRPANPHGYAAVSALNRKDDRLPSSVGSERLAEAS